MKHSKKLKTELAYTKKGAINMPDRQILKVWECMHLESLKGYRFIQAVMVGNKCLGWHESKVPVDQ